MTTNTCVYLYLKALTSTLIAFNGTHVTRNKNERDTCQRCGGWSTSVKQGNYSIPEIFLSVDINS